MSPIAPGIKVAQIHTILESKCYPGHGHGYLAGDKRLTPNRRFVIEKNAIAGIHAIGLTIVNT
jgi:hypothetical protein